MKRFGGLLALAICSGALMPAAFAHECRKPAPKVERVAKAKPAIRHHARPVNHPYFWPTRDFLGFRYLTTQ